MSKLILTADIHISEKTPACRTDDYIKAQLAKLRFLAMLQEEHEAPILDAGDFCDRWDAPHLILNKVIKCLRKFKYPFYTIPGNHDLPQHRVGGLSESALGTFVAAGLLSIIPDGVFNFEGRRIKVLHKFVYKSERPIYASLSCSAKNVLADYQGFDLVLTGDNHDPFVYKSGGRLLVNPGSMLRSTVQQIDHEPRVYVYDSETNTVSRVYYPVESGCISTEARDIRVAREQSSLNAQNVAKQLALRSEKYIPLPELVKQMLSRIEDEPEVIEILKGIIYGK